MTPSDLVGMCLLNGQQLIALTDHNTARNCPAAAYAAGIYGIGFIPGIEVTTSEDIHVICLFPSLEPALDFDQMLYEHIPDIPNNPAIFGEQVICNAHGEPRDTEPRLLIAGCDISVMDLPGVVNKYSGICYPAHIDRAGNGLLSILGLWPMDLDVKAAEAGLRGLAPGEKASPDILGLIPENLKIIRASDAHRLQDLPLYGFEIDMESPDFTGLAQWLEAGDNNPRDGSCP